MPGGRTRKKNRMSRVLKFEKPGGKAAAPVASKLENGTRRWRREDGGGSDYMRGLGEKRSRSIKQVLTGGSTKKNNKNNNHHERKRGDKECWMRGGKLISIWIQKTFFIFLLSYPGLGAQ
jgi:hypothetical protein